MRKDQYENYIKSKSVYVVTSDICDYEVRRSLILESKKKTNINSIESLKNILVDILRPRSACRRQTATNNVKHLSYFTEAKQWQNIKL